MEDGDEKEADVAKALSISLAAVRRWRTEEKGPRYLKLGTLVRYRLRDVNEWLQSRPAGGEDHVQSSKRNHRSLSVRGNTVGARVKR